ncbi:hypothetical protein CTEN210_03223 [Chaetoceros tenuissimus]|uniref:Uncharacterized protein n=1 Tax=Chaetoceros tenuissimus TaxID=426638 RepID=A0AAD3CJC6_9STRA|nr:hypothetical protein CTEN210_03223 [Chaetoceros tenuissimus]
MNDLIPSSSTLSNEASEPIKTILEAQVVDFDTSLASNSNGSEQYEYNQTCHTGSSDSEDLTTPADLAFVEESSNVLRAVLDELDMERARRIQAEIRLAELPQKRKEELKQKEAQDAKRNQDEQDAQLEEEMNDYASDFSREKHLVIALEIKKIFENKTKIPKKKLYNVLHDLFENLFTITIRETCGTIKCPTSVKRQKQKRIKEAIHHVQHEIDSGMSRLMRTDYEENDLKSSLEIVAKNFVHDLIMDSGGGKFRKTLSDQDQQSYEEKLTELSSLLNEFRRTSAKETKVLTIERDEYRSLLDSLTSTNKAITLANQKEDGTLPFYQTRLLEISPWDEKVNDYIQCTDEFYEWQAFDPRTGKWNEKKLGTNPYFQNLPFGNVDMNTCGENEEKSAEVQTSPKKKFLFSNAAQSSVCTNIKLSYILDLSDGFPVPKQGTWEWINTWGVITYGSDDAIESTTLQRLSCTEDIQGKGWVHAASMKSLLNNEKCTCIPQANSRFRRRKWNRTRVLLSYPGISPTTLNMLKMHAQNSKLTMAVSKLERQVADMQREMDIKEKEYEERNAELSRKLLDKKTMAEEKEGTIQKLKNQLSRYEVDDDSSEMSHSDDFHIEKKPLLVMKEEELIADDDAISNHSVTKSVDVPQSVISPKKSDLECAEELVDSIISIFQSPSSDKGSVKDEDEIQFTPAKNESPGIKDQLLLWKRGSNDRSLSMSEKSTEEKFQMRPRLDSGNLKDIIFGAKGSKIFESVKSNVETMKTNVQIAAEKAQRIVEENA